MGIRNTDIYERWAALGAYTQNSYGEWVPLAYEPYYHRFRMGCSCGRKFWTKEGYQAHYSHVHLMGFGAKSNARSDEGAAPNNIPV